MTPAQNRARAAGAGPAAQRLRCADQNYDTAASALLWTLEQGLGAAFTPDVKSA